MSAPYRTQSPVSFTSRPALAAAVRAVLAIVAVCFLAVGPWLSWPVAAQDSSTVSAEQQLIEKYAPIVELKQRTSLCDSKGEQFIPAPVEIVLNDPAVRLRQAEKGGSSKTDPVIVAGPSAQDLYRLDRTYYLDLPGNPLSPKCTYARFNEERMANFEPTTYAHVVSNGLNRLAVQYWFFYAFNDFNNKHESDWEMMQLVWDVPTVEAALLVAPTSMALAQHGGGETADWDDAKVQKDGNHPIVFPSSGSHATQYGNAVYLGWGENGTGFGCDTATAPSVRVLPKPVLLPGTVPPKESEFAWVMFQGRWGERLGGQYDGPTGPRMKPRWLAPFTWQEGLRESSIIVPESDTFGPGPTTVFCTLSSYGSSLFTVLGTSVPLVGSIAGCLLLSFVGLAVYARETIAASLRMYVRHWRTFAVIGISLIPIGIVFNGFQYLVTKYPPGSLLFRLMDEGSDYGSFTAAFLVGIVQHLVGYVFVAPAVIAAYVRIEAGERVSLIAVYREALRHVPAIAAALGLALVPIVPLTLVVIGLPVAVWLVLRWAFLPQAIILDGKRGRGALTESARTVGGGKTWLHAAAVGLLFLAIGAAPGPLTGLFFMVARSRSVDFANTASSLIYAVFMPFSILGYIILYRELQMRGKASTANRESAARTTIAGESGLASTGAD